MNLDELQSIQSRERQATSLQNLRPTFYQDVGEFIQELVRERDRAAERADDPFSSPEVRRLTDDIETAKSTVEAVYERRIGKVVKSASIAAAGMPTDDDGLTEEERALFETLVDRIERNREQVLDGVLEGEGSDLSCARGGPADGAPVGSGADTGAPPVDDADTTAAADDPSPDPSDPAAEPSAAAELGLDPTGDTDDAAATDGSVSAADLMGGGSGSGTNSDPDPGPDDSAPGPATPEPPTGTATSEAAEPETGDMADEPVERTTVRITRDVGEVFGVDERAYELSADDVVTLPSENAGPLVERDAAERLD
jgi:DNA replication factor GINS